MTPARLITTALLLATAVLAQEPSDGVLGNSLWETLDKGGAIMYVILAASVVGVTFLLEVAFRTRRSAILPKTIERQLDDHGGDAAIEHVINQPKPTSIRKIVNAGRYWRHGSREEIESAIEEAVDEELWRLRRAARPIGIIANTTPLLGLLGTVVGIIQAFDVVAQEGALGDPSSLAGGISKALLTTCFGLIVAIPMLLAYHYYMGRIEALLRRSEALAKENLILPPKEPTFPPEEPTPPAKPKKDPEGK